MVWWFCWIGKSWLDKELFDQLTIDNNSTGDMFDHNVDEDGDDPGEEDHEQLSAANTAVAVGSIGLLEHEMFVDTCSVLLLPV